MGNHSDHGRYFSRRRCWGGVYVAKQTFRGLALFVCSASFGAVVGIVIYGV